MGADRRSLNRAGMERRSPGPRAAKPAKGGPVVDLFAGAGGWDVAASDLGLETIGLELDEAAYATREAAGLPTVRCDVAAVDPADFAACGETFGLIASPSCQVFSLQGPKRGLRDGDLVRRAITDLLARRDTRRELGGRCLDERSILVAEAARWALALEPEWIALEQVPTVLRLWRELAVLLRPLGYSTWAGVLEAERYGAPQTRERAILVASRRRAAQPPRPTHQRYVCGEPPRHEVTLEGELLPWVSIERALGWDVDGVERPPLRYRNGNQARSTVRRVDEPAPTILFGRRSNRVEWLMELPDGHLVRWARVTVEEAGVLQGFPRDYPWQGSMSRRYTQVGNAVPVQLARAILGELAGVAAC